MSQIKLFESKLIRSQWDEKEQEWFFVVVDVIGVLTDSLDPKDYWYRMKKREKLSGYELSTVCRQLKIEATDGKKYATDCRAPLRCARNDKYEKRHYPQSRNLIFS
jgi:hypothetical protein